MNKGVSTHLFKSTAKRRRSKIQIEEERELEKRRKLEVDEKMAQFEQMQAQMNMMQQQIVEDQPKIQAVTKLF